jgi:DNA-binding HxlR family transcriptional regulator
MSARSYDQYCAVATALDTVGDRWTFLLIRELLSGPKRYTDLLDGLPGISTDVLAARLRDLEAQGVVERQMLPPPAASKVYQLTDDGAALEPVLIALAHWGRPRLPPTQQGEFRPHWLTLLLRSMFQPGATDMTVTVDFLVDDGRLRAVLQDGTLNFDHQPEGPADVVIKGDPAALAALARSAESRVAALAQGRVAIEGDPQLISALQRAFGLEPAAP